MDLLQETI